MSIGNIMLERQGLIRLFDELKNHRILAVQAPAGYGKTVAVSQWLDKDMRAKATLSIDEYDNNIAGFCERFCATLLMCQPRNQTLNSIVSHPSFQNDPEEFALRAISALSSIKQAVLVLDDLHLIYNNKVLELLLVFIGRLPKKFQVVLISRSNLPPVFASLLIKGQVARIDAEQLLFTDKEITALFKKRDNQITQTELNDIIEQTHGWAIGINAFLLSDGRPSDYTYEHLGDFVKANIWENWDEQTCEFMLRTSFLRELTPSLCTALTGNPNSDKFLKELVQKGAFITQTQKNIYRYHHLFQQFLKEKVRERGQGFLYDILNTEGQYQLSQGDFYNAVDCFMRCKNHDGIAECFDLPELTKHNILVAERLFPILSHPETIEVAKKHPRLLYLMIWFACAEGRADDMFSFMDEYYARHSEIVANHPAFAHEIHYIRILDSRMTLSQALDKIGIPDDPSKFVIHHWKMSMHKPLLHRGIVDYSHAATKGVVKYMESVIYPKTAWLYGGIVDILAEAFTAGLLYEQGNLDEAYGYALKANAGLKTSHLPDTKFSTMSMLAHILDAVGKPDEADLIINSIWQMIEETKAYHAIHNFKALSARRKFLKGDTKTAWDWLGGQTPSGKDQTLRSVYADFVTSRAFIAVEKFDNAIILLKKILGVANDFKRPLDIIEAQILLSIAYWKKGNKFQSTALGYLEDAVRVARPYGYVQMFANDGVQLVGMLHKLVNRIKQQPQFIEDGLLSFVKLLYLKARDSQSAEVVKEADKKAVQFTDRQKAVAQLLCQGKNYNEIAENLGIKKSSVRTHLTFIYNKLDVTNGVDAVAKINSMGLLD